MVWVAQNWPALLSCVSMVIGLGVAIAHMAQKNNVASQLEAVDEIIKKLIDSGKNPPAPPSAPAV